MTTPRDRDESGDASGSTGSDARGSTGSDARESAGSDAVDLQCRDCGRRYEPGPDEPWRCECGHALDVAEQPIPGGGAPAFSAFDSREGLWAFFEFLPVSRQVSLGEGFTPLVRSEAWGAQFKLEYVLPTGSFKDRGATTTLSRAVELGVGTVLEDSSGNAGAAIATYAARAGIDAEIYVPANLPQSKLVAIQRAGARPVRIEGDREAVGEACREAVAAGDGWYASHAWHPAFLAGTMTFALELAAQRDWSLPDAVVVPTGNGTLLLGAYRGFRALQGAGIVEELPRLLVAQAAGYAPIANAVGSAAAGTDDLSDLGEFVPADPDAAEAGEGAAFTAAAGDPSDADPSTAIGTTSSGGGLDAGAGDAEDWTNEIADGIHVSSPPRESQLHAAIDDTGGDAIAVGEDRLELTLDRLHRAGFYVEPTAAVGPAALERFREAGVVDPGDDVVVPLTGSGSNTM